MLRVVGEKKPIYLQKDYSTDIPFLGKGQLDRIQGHFLKALQLLFSMR